MKTHLYQQVHQALMTEEPSAKCQLTNQLYTAWQQGQAERIDFPVERIDVPGRPAKPTLVQPKYLVKRKMNTAEGRAALLHAIGHIEFNAINLALDAVYRFQHMPDDYVSDWLKVASEEALHFSLVAEYIQELGFPYGSFPAHNGLWEMAKKTRQDVLVRMALVPRILEARGLDVTPGIMEKYAAAEDYRAIDILKVIQRDEVGHVRIGNHWFKYCCKQQGIEPLEKFKILLDEYAVNQIRKPILHGPRLEAGFTQADLAHLESIAI